MRRDVSALTEVPVPADFMLATVRTYLQDHAGDGGAAHLSIGLALPANLTLATNVTATTRHVRRGPDSAALDIDWQPDRRGAYPSFHGTFRAEPREPGTCTLSLAGSYVAPGGLAGRIFDAMLGRRAANETFVKLLATLRGVAQHDYHIRMTE